jgi:hypothetical protein
MVIANKTRPYLYDSQDEPTKAPCSNSWFSHVSFHPPFKRVQKQTSGGGGCQSLSRTWLPRLAKKFSIFYRSRMFINFSQQPTNIPYWLLDLIFEIFFFFRKSVEKIQLWLKYDKNIGYFTWRPMYICDISLNSSYNKKCFGQKFLSSITFLEKSAIFWDIMEKDHRSKRVTDGNITRRMLFACRITKATDTLGIYNTYCFFITTIVSQERLIIT